MNATDDILKAEKPSDDKGWIEYCILKMWEECSSADEYIADNASAELSALRARVEALEHLEAVAQDVNEWLKTSAGLKGSAHQQELEAALKA